MPSYITKLPAQACAAIRPRSLAIMGSTGSIGVNTLRVVAENPDAFRIVTLAGGSNVALLAKQAAQWRPTCLGVIDENARKALIPLLPAGYSPQIFCGPEGYAALASLPEADMVLSAQVGAAGIYATEAAVRAGKMVALANKESLVLAGELLRSSAEQSGAVILPVDSEHNAIFQCLQGHEPGSVRRIILTASGGPFRDKTKEYLEQVTPEDALAHPNWSMGAKISIDSATMMNKGLEIIEAHHLYGLPLERIGVLIHPQSIVHSLVEYIDGSLLAQASQPDMRIPIGHCLAWPRRIPCGVPSLDLTRTKPLTFAEPDLSLFPCLALARTALQEGKGLPIVLNAANEVAVALFLDRKIPFTGIAKLVRTALETYTGTAPATFDDTLLLDACTRERLASLG